MAKIGVFHDAWNVLFNLTATDGGAVDAGVAGIRSVTGRFVGAIIITVGVGFTVGYDVPFVGITLGYDGRTVENEFELTTLDEVIKGGK